MEEMTNRQAAWPAIKSGILMTMGALIAAYIIGSWTTLIAGVTYVWLTAGITIWFLLGLSHYKNTGNFREARNSILKAQFCIIAGLIIAIIFDKSVTSSLQELIYSTLTCVFLLYEYHRVSKHEEKE